MNRGRMFLGVAFASVVVACTFTRDLDYLTQGTGDDAGQTPNGDGGTSSSGNVAPGVVAGEILVSEQLNPANLLQDADNLYWSTSDNRVMRVAKSGGRPTQLTQLEGAGAGAVHRMALEPGANGNLYLLTNAGVKTLPRNGGAPADFVAGADTYEIVADENYLFALSTDDNDEPTLRRHDKANPASSAVLSLPKSSGDTGSGAMKIFGGEVYWTSNDSEGTQVLYQLPANASAGTPPATWKNTARNVERVAAGVNAIEPFELAVDADGIYWVDSDYRVPYRMTRNEIVAEAPSLLPATNASAVSIAADATTIWILTADRLIRMPKAGGEPTPLGAETSGSEVIVDEDAVYYVFVGSDDVRPTGGIRRVPK